jgi:hypothetical protein
MGGRGTPCISLGAVYLQMETEVQLFSPHSFPTEAAHTKDYLKKVLVSKKRRKRQDDIKLDFDP